MVIPGSGATLAPGRVGAPPSERTPDAAAATDTLEEPVTVALTTPVDPAHAPWPRSASERLLFAQLYEPLVRLDCTGRVVAALARSWSLDSSRVPGRAEWRFVIGDGLRFHGGERVTAANVIESWRASAVAHAGQPSGALIAAIAAGGRALDDSTLMVSLPDSLASPRTFASAALAVARRSPGSEWPDGTTSYQVESSVAAGEGSAPARSIALRSSTAPPLLFRIYQQGDARDILDAGVDLLATASPVAVQYAATQSGRALIELPWTRTYTIALPSRDPAGDESDRFDRAAAYAR